MNRREQDKLLKELLSGEEVSDFRQVSLAGGLAAMRRRWQRRTVRMGMMTLLPLLAAIAVLVYRRSEPKARQMASVKSPTPAVSKTKAETAGVKIISDDELFALFPGRAMALVGKPGEQQLVFLDGGSAQARVR